MKRKIYNLEGKELRPVKCSGFISPRGTMKLKNKRVSVQRIKHDSWFFHFKKLEEGKVVITEMVLSDEAAIAMFSLMKSFLKGRDI